MDSTTNADATVAEDAAPKDAEASDAGLEIGEPITAPPDTWTWIDFPDTACNDGSPTGLGINPSSTSGNFIIFLMGGGACWDYQTCFDLHLATEGPFGATQFAIYAQVLGTGAFDRRRAENPFKDWNQVFIPYCTGDTHAGDNVVTYVNNGMMGEWHHVGRKNFLAYVKRLAPTFPVPSKWLLTGSSAGGYGASYNYATARLYWPIGQGYMIDDSGPAMVGDAVSPALREAWIQNWNLGPAIDALCGAECRDDFSLAYPKLSSQYPNDRLALLSSLQDNTIRSFLNLTGPAFEAALLDMAEMRIDPTANFKYFFVSGNSHTMLATPETFNSGNKNLYDWMTEMVEDSDGWASTKP